MAKQISFSVQGLKGVEKREEAVTRIICAGYAGRDQGSVRRHIEELKALGVPAPEEIPAFYLVPAERVTAGTEITVDGASTSGEVEFVLLKTASGTLVTVGSDHTDRELEKSDVPLSKAVCPKVIGPTFWHLSDLADHWDRLRLKSSVNVDGHLVPYQDGYLSELMEPRDIERRLAESLPAFSSGDMLFSGTIPSKRGLVISDLFAMELLDEVSGRSIKHSYKITQRDGQACGAGRMSR